LVSVFGHDLFVRNGRETASLVCIPALSGLFSPYAINLRIGSVEVSQDHIDEPQLLDIRECLNLLLELIRR
jgi:hypothetical protein